MQTIGFVVTILVVLPDVLLLGNLFAKAAQTEPFYYYFLLRRTGEAS